MTNTPHHSDTHSIHTHPSSKSALSLSLSLSHIRTHTHIQHTGLQKTQTHSGQRILLHCHFCPFRAMLSLSSPKTSPLSASVSLITRTHAQYFVSVLFFLFLPSQEYPIFHFHSLSLSYACHITLTHTLNIKQRTHQTHKQHKQQTREAIYRHFALMDSERDRRDTGEVAIINTNGLMIVHQNIQFALSPYSHFTPPPSLLFFFGNVLPSSGEDEGHYSHTHPQHLFSTTPNTQSTRLSSLSFTSIHPYNDDDDDDGDEQFHPFILGYFFFLNLRENRRRKWERIVWK
ncbi:MAG: hypothetical protein JOS17DRAFT_150898 [Linnemannia elongata]|nr:MAG: hypothetical protein JOS17DRAFT_150898 [Linnemannia elongata]